MFKRMHLLFYAYEAAEDEDQSVWPLRLNTANVPLFCILDEPQTSERAARGVVSDRNRVKFSQVKHAHVSPATTPSTLFQFVHHEHIHSFLNSSYYAVYARSLSH